MPVKSGMTALFDSEPESLQSASVKVSGPFAVFI